MRKYHQGRSFTIYHGDCREVLPHLSGGHLIVSDVAYRGISGGTGQPGQPSGILASNDGRIFKHNNITSTEYAPLFYQALVDRAHIYVFINNLNLEQLLRDFRINRMPLHNLLRWAKNSVTPSRWYMKDYEHIAFFHKGTAFPINDPSAKSTLPYPVVPQRFKLHPTEKPTSLLGRLIINSSKPKQVVIDPFVGSGSTLEAAVRNCRQAIGIETDEYYADLAARRLELVEQGWRYEDIALHLKKHLVKNYQEESHVGSRIFQGR